MMLLAAVSLLVLFCRMEDIGPRPVVVIDTVHCVLVWTFARRDSELCQGPILNNSTFLFKYKH